MKKQPEPQEQREPDRRTTLARWRCPDCGIFSAGYIEQLDYKPRRCQGIPRNRDTRETRDGRPICGALMVQVQGENKPSR